MSFLEIEKIIEQQLNLHEKIKNPDLETILEIDKQVRKNILNVIELKVGASFESKYNYRLHFYVWLISFYS